MLSDMGGLTTVPLTNKPSLSKSSPSAGILTPWTPLSPGCSASLLHLSTLCPNVYTGLVHHTSPTQHLNCSSLPLWLGICSNPQHLWKQIQSRTSSPTILFHLNPAPANSYGRGSAPTHNIPGRRSSAEHFNLPHLFQWSCLPVQYILL